MGTVHLSCALNFPVKFFYIVMSLLVPLLTDFILYYSHIGYKNLRKLLEKINSNIYIIKDKIMSP